jgi:2-polyprenyl-3-methyl-5-hydroxy-6-metoxy-1,4-benzoquinol methylase
MSASATLPSPQHSSVPPLPTFRDPAGTLTFAGDSVLRQIRPEARAAVLAFVTSPFCRRLQQRGCLIDAEIDDAPSGLTLRHPRIAVPTYPWEWTARQWLAAAELTLTLAEEALAEGWILKDATPLNVLFVGARPIFVDILSFERHNPHSVLWLPYGQYMRTFLLPLLMHRLAGWPLALSLLHRDGFQPAVVYDHLNWRARLSPAVFWPVTLPALLERRQQKTPAAAAAKPPAQQDPGFVQHQLLRTFSSLRRRTQRAVSAWDHSAWSEYRQSRAHYTPAESAQKGSFVRQTIAELKPRRVLDIGANTGEHSMLAASLGAEVVAIERDAAAAEQLFLAASREHLAIQTIVADLARPTPAAGWENLESSSLLTRLEAQFDLVLMLAVIHHLILLDQIPIPAILALLARLTRSHLILEWVPVTDPMFQTLMRGRDSLYAHLTVSDLEAAAAPHFQIVRQQTLQNGRILYLFERRQTAGDASRTRTPQPC